MNIEDDTILSSVAMKDTYGEFYVQSRRIAFDINDVPTNLRLLVPYAEFWGIADDLLREQLVDMAPANIKRNLKRIVTRFEDELDEWLAGPESSSPNPTDAYVAFSAMRMSADYT